MENKLHVISLSISKDLSQKTMASSYLPKHLHISPAKPNSNALFSSILSPDSMSFHALSYGLALLHNTLNFHEYNYSTGKSNI